MSFKTYSDLREEVERWILIVLCVVLLAGKIYYDVM